MSFAFYNPDDPDGVAARAAGADLSSRDPEVVMESPTYLASPGDRESIVPAAESGRDSEVHGNDRERPTPEREGLSKKQKTALVSLARKAFDIAVENGLADADEFAEWRHQEAKAASKGRVTISTARNEDYVLLRGHFRMLSGDEVRAFDDGLRDQPKDDSRRKASYVLKKECKRSEVPYPAYPRKLCADKFHCALSDADSSQLWALVYSVRNRHPDKLKQPRMKPEPPPR